MAVCGTQGEDPVTAAVRVSWGRAGIRNSLQEAGHTGRTCAEPRFIIYGLDYDRY